MTGVASRVSHQVVLVLGFRFPEIARRFDFGNHLPRPQTGRVDILNRVHCDLLLLFAGVKDRGSVRGSAIIALAILCSRVMYLKKEL